MDMLVASMTDAFLLTWCVVMATQMLKSSIFLNNGPTGAFGRGGGGVQERTVGIRIKPKQQSLSRVITAHIHTFLFC